LEYIKVLPAARYSEFADNLLTLAANQAMDKPWVGQMLSQQRRLVIAHDPEVAARRTRARNAAIQELLALGQ